VVVPQRWIIELDHWFTVRMLHVGGFGGDGESDQWRQRAAAAAGRRVVTVVAYEA
jgi:hypothetical protein